LTDKPTSLGLPPVEIYRNDTTSTIVKSNLTHWQILKKYIFTNLNMWILAISGIFVYFSFGFILDWSTLFMVSRGISKSKAAYLLSLLPFVGCFGGITGGILIDKFFKGRAVPVIVIFLFGLFISFVGIYKFTTSTTAWWIIGFFLSLAGFFSDGPQILGSMVASNLVPTESVGAGCGFVGLFHYIGTFLSGICIALIIEKWDWYGGFIIASLSCLVAMLSTALIWNKEKTKI
ncbi:MAG: MFS transporter, partial [Endomicrobium sp.]|nr:MFS transporter [Endomicrobium sp.]